MNADIFSDAEVIAIFNKALNEPTLEEKETKRVRRARRAKIDFFNLEEVTEREINL
ncbi:hypothetical protein [Prevotella sp. HUN102]|uniref:hypothetical protein n=1 Tax=Prevotella sp. HUN102 TaxID=1392486 RepID=UPI000B33F89C|nr:hypothetical protein [Prevotella sp. HUN102]